MIVGCRHATQDDLEALVDLYRDLEREQADLKAMWPLLDGLELPVEGAFREILDDVRSILLVGLVDDVPVGLLWARSEPMLRRAGDERVAVVRLVYTDPDARGVGVGESMITLALDELRQRGHRRFDALVSPGHRLAKNFFEQSGFSARLIVMHREDEPG